ncbi:MAG: sulfite exporter TauE/SafE family protein [Clostridiales bacterium]|jgi:uncharacterized membrane protein YfcA|nr:sulfite exporter TauE/SafE family protein [Clostridiales bacterium]
MTAVLLIGIGLLSGVISGMGIGGGTVLIPALSIFFSVSQQQAQNINLIYFVPTAVIALITHVKEKNIEGGFLLPIILFGLAGAVAGSMIAIRIDAELLRKLFAGFLFVMGLLEFFKKDSGQA